MPTNFELERLKPKLDTFKIHENRVHELTDSNVSLSCGAGFEEYRVLDSTESREESMLRSRHFIFKFASF